MKRLNSALLSTLPNTIVQPKFDTKQSQAGIVHIGIGAFHRGHQAVFTSDVLDKYAGDWRITGVSLRSATVGQQLNPQDGLYTVTQNSPTGSSTRVISAIDKVLVASEDCQSVIQALASKRTHIVTLTVTEKGYHYDAVADCLQHQSADIQDDILTPDQPKTLPGFLFAACKERMLTHGQKLSVISCDNLANNGEVCQTVVMDYAKKVNAEVADWIALNVHFCSSMVDRIVPAVTDTHRQQFAEKFGFIDKGMIQTEPFKQWVIEDNFGTPRPAWEKVGALIVKDVSPYEKNKLRTLNASHSFLAYSGALLGFKWIHEAVYNPVLRQLALRLMRQEMQNTLPIPDGFDIASYQDSVIERFENHCVPYATQQVAMDGSQKLMQRMFLPALELIEKNQPVLCIAATVALWIRYLQGVDEHGTSYPIHDPLAEQLINIVSAHAKDKAALIKALMTQTSVFPKQLSANQDFIEQLTACLQKIEHHGVAYFLAEL